MKVFKILSTLTILALAVGMFGFAPSNVPVAQAAPTSTVIYNLYATDAFVQLADGTVLYNYGFVGGRQGVPLTFQNSMKAAVNPGGFTTIATGAPAPTGGIVTPAELQLQGNAQFPAPLIYAAVNDVVEIRLKNLGVTNKGSPNDPHSIHLHGLDVDAANDGVPETSVGAVPANLAATPGAGNVIVYMFSPTKPGTYMYHCHQEADIHVQMGMYGALVVYNPTDPAYLNGGPGKGFGGDLWGWKYDKDVVLLLSEIDTRQHTSEQTGFVGGGAVFNPVNYQPQYWFINGLSFPNTIHAAGAPVKGAPAFNWGDPTVTNCSPPPAGKTCGWINAHPGYDPFIIGSIGTTSSAGTRGEKVLLRTINMGFETQPMHMHGFHAKILGSDQRPWPWTAGGLEKNTLTIGSGETYEWLLDFGTWASVASTYPAGTQSKYDPATNAPVSNQSTVANCLIPALNSNCAIPDPFVLGQTYIGGSTVGPTNKDLLSVASVLAKGGGVPPGAAIQGQLFPFHNHDDYKATNNGVYPGGMFTMIMTVP